MNARDRILAVLALGVAGYFLITRSAAGQPLFSTSPIVPTVGGISPSLSTSTGATNVFSALTNSISGLLGSVFTKGPGNSPGTTIGTPYGSGAVNTDVFGNSVYVSAAGVTPLVSPGDPALSSVVPYLPWTNPTSLIDAPPPSDPSADASSLSFTNDTPTLDYQDVG